VAAVKSRNGKDKQEMRVTEDNEYDTPFEVKVPKEDNVT
jgi:hypothetical protein